MNNKTINDNQYFEVNQLYFNLPRLYSLIKISIQHSVYFMIEFNNNYVGHFYLRPLEQITCSVAWLTVLYEDFLPSILGFIEAYQ